jgi:hypothetical protein
MRPEARKGVRVLTADCTTEQIIKQMERMAVDSGTHAGSHVPVGDFCSIVREDLGGGSQHV